MAGAVPAPLKPSQGVADPTAVSDNTQAGYEYFAPPPAAPPRTSPDAGQQWGVPDPRRALNPVTTAPEMWRLPRWANMLSSILAVLMIGGLVTAVGLPMIARHRLNSQFESTSISLPKTFNGQPGVSSGRTEQQLEAVAAEFSSTSARIYGKNTLGLILIAGFRPKQAMSKDDQAEARIQLVKQLNNGNTGSALILTPFADPGPLGGYFGCGTIAPATVCIASDPGSMVAVVVGPAVPHAQSVALKAREASVKRS